MSKHAIHIQEFSNELQNFIDRTHPMEEFGVRSDPDKEMDQILSDVALATGVCAAIAKEVEYFMNGDISRVTFLARYKQIEKEYGPKLA